MIVYHGMNMVNRLKAIVRHLVHNSDKKCILIGEFDESYKEFKNVEHIIEYVPFVTVGVKLQGEEYVKYTLDFFDNAFKEIGVTLDEIEEFYVGSYHGNFAHYLQLKKIKHFFVEESAGSLKFSDNNNFITKKFVTLSEVDKEARKKEKCLVNYEICKEIFKLKHEERDQIINFYNVPKATEEDYDILLLTQWWFDDNGYDPFAYDDVIYMYGLILDYYYPNEKVYIKPHPKDELKAKYLDYFTDCHLDTSVYPSELMGLIPNIHFNKVVTINSSSLFTLLEFCDEVDIIGLEYEDLHHRLIKFDLAIQLSNFLSEFNYNIVRYGIYDRDVSVFPNFFDDIPKSDCLENNSILISDELYLTKITRKGKFRNATELNDDEQELNKIGAVEKFISALKNTNNVFIITNYFEEIFNKCVLDFNHVIVFKITKDKVKNICAADMQNEYVYVYCKDIAIRNKILEFSFFKHLFQTGIIVKSKILNLEETQLHFENIKLQSKQVELNKKVKMLEQGIVQTQKQNQTLKNELIKVIQKSNALEKFAVDSKNIIEMYKQEFIKVNKRLNELEK